MAAWRVFVPLGKRDLQGVRCKRRKIPCRKKRGVLHLVAMRFKLWSCLSSRHTREVSLNTRQSGRSTWVVSRLLAWRTHGSVCQVYRVSHGVEWALLSVSHTNGGLRERFGHDYPETISTLIPIDR